jgi:deoxyribonuclease V
MAEVNVLTELKKRELLILRERVQRRIKPKGSPKRIKRIAGVDIVFTEEAGKIHVCASLCSYPRMVVLEEAIATDDIDRSLTEDLGNIAHVPLILSVLKMLKAKYDIIMIKELPFRGESPLSSYLGVIAGHPAIGISPRGGGLKRFARWEGARRAGAVKIRGHKTPLGVVAGHLIAFKEAAGLVKACCTDSRIPEPVRDAGNRVRAWEREWRRLNLEGR